MKKIPPKLLVIVAVVLSLIAAGLVYSMLTKKQKPVQAPKPTTAQVVVAAQQISAETEIKEEMLKIVQMPLEAAQGDAFRNKKDVVGKKTVQAIMAGDQVTRRRFSAAPNSGMQISIPKDKRAVTIPVDEISSIAGFVKPGQFVDVINVVAKSGKNPTVGKMILQNVLVLGTGQRDMSSVGSGKAEKVGTVTLAVDPRDAVKLRVAQQEGGRISLALRPLKPEEDEVMGTLVVGSGADMSGLSQKSAPTTVVPQKQPITIIRGTSGSK